MQILGFTGPICWTQFLSCTVGGVNPLYTIITSWIYVTEINGNLKTFHFQFSFEHLFKIHCEIVVFNAYSVLVAKTLWIEISFYVSTTNLPFSCVNALHKGHCETRYHGIIFSSSHAFINVSSMSVCQISYFLGVSQI